MKFIKVQEKEEGSQKPIWSYDNIGQNHEPIQVISRKQKLVTRSSTKAELVALSLAVEELLHLDTSFMENNNNSLKKCANNNK